MLFVGCLYLGQLLQMLRAALEYQPDFFGAFCLP